MENKIKAIFLNEYLDYDFSKYIKEAVREYYTAELVEPDFHELLWEENPVFDTLPEKVTYILIGIQTSPNYDDRKIAIYAKEIRKKK